MPQIPAPNAKANGRLCSAKAPNSTLVPIPTLSISNVWMLSAVARSAATIRLFCTAMRNGCNTLNTTRSANIASTDNQARFVTASNTQAAAPAKQQLTSS